MSDEADRRRTYRELEKRGQPTPGKYYYKRKPTVTNRFSDIMLPEKKRTTRIT